MKKNILCVLCALVILCLCGCSTKKEDVKLKTEKEITQYASNKYGTAIYVSKETNTNLIKYSLQDKEYKFDYECTSYISKLCIDATCAELYDETTTCNFDTNYKKFIIDTLNLDNIYEDYITNYPSNSERKFIFAVNYENEEMKKENLQEITKKFKKIDNRKYYDNYHIAVYDNNNIYIGVYDTTTNKYIDRYEEAVEQMTRSFAVEVNNSSSNLNGITFLNYKRIQYKDVEKLQLEWIDKNNITENDWTTAYYFKYNDNIYFMLDDKVFIKDESFFNRRIYDKYYTSYWFND